MTTETKIFELLDWVKSHGMAPAQVQAGDRYLCSVTRRIMLGSKLNNYQKRTAYWLPTRDGLKKLGVILEEGKIGQLTTMKMGPFFGAGCGESEAVLSALNQVKEKLAA